MTAFSDYEIICNQYVSLLHEISSLIDEEEYEIVLDKIEYKNKLIKKLFLAKKTVHFTTDEKEKTTLLEQAIHKYEKNMIETFEKYHSEIKQTLKNTYKKVKINSAYTIHTEENNGTFVNIME